MVYMVLQSVIVYIVVFYHVVSGSTPNLQLVFHGFLPFPHVV